MLEERRVLLWVEDTPDGTCFLKGALAGQLETLLNLKFWLSWKFEFWVCVMDAGQRVTPNYMQTLTPGVWLP